MTVDTTFLPKTNGMVFGDRLQARADKGRVFLMADVTPPPAELTIVSNAVLSGDPYVGSTITCADPVVSGGLEPYSYDYMWLDAATTRSAINNTTLLEFDLGKSVSCYVTVVSADGQTIHTTSNSIGPVTYEPALATINQALDPSYNLAPGNRLSLIVQATGKFDLSYTWQMRNADDSGWITANENNLAAEFPDANVLLFEPNRDNEPGQASFMINLISGPGPSQMRCRVRDTDPAGEFNQKVTQTTIDYI